MDFDLHQWLVTVDVDSKSCNGRDSDYMQV